MRLTTLLFSMCLASASVLPMASNASPAHKVEPTVAGSFVAGKGSFLLNGKPFVIKAAELHYPRIPRAYWNNRIMLCKALGMNTICLYVFWNVHEAEPGKFDFDGQNDLAEFCRLCKQNGLYVILRPGPYVCAEWEMGGLPWWLLKKKDIRLREDDPDFMERVELFEKAVADQLRDLTIQKGGPILMIQVENEYGAYDENKKYVALICDMLRKEYGGDMTLFQCDWSSTFKTNGLDDLLWTMNFGTGSNIDAQFKALKQERPDTPLMCSEFWSGWFDKWGTNHETRDAKSMVAGIDEMLSKNISFSLYMTHGGTNWGHWAGANTPPYAPDVTSYDYDAPISESGQTTPKYWELRNTLSKYMYGEKQSPVPSTIKPATIAPFSFTEVAPLFSNLPQPKGDSIIKTMEDYDQGFGSILYRTSLPELKNGGRLKIDEAHDYAQVFVDGRYVGKLDRRLDEKELTLPVCRKDARLDILVEAMGRVNFGWGIKDYKGITKNVELSLDIEGYKFVCDLKNWQVYNLPDAYEFYSQMHFAPLKSVTDAQGQRQPGVYRATFNVKKPADTFLNFETWGKGLVYVNGIALGRIWQIGPQQTLYVPGCWLRKGQNEILVFDIIGPSQAKTEGLATPIIDKLQQAGRLARNDQDLYNSLRNTRPVASGAFKPGNGWQEVRFGQTARGRYLCLEALSAIDGGDQACIAELYAIDNRGKRLSRDSWNIRFADSEDISGVNCAADKVYDLQESTSWSTEKGRKYPHAIIIDLGAEHAVSGIDYLPRMESNVPGAIKYYKVYLK